MRTTIAAGLLLLTATLASANIVQVPWTSENVFKIVLGAYGQPRYTLVGTFFDEDTWDSHYVLGDRPDYLSLIQTDFFANKPTNTATISWDFPDVHPGISNVEFIAVRAIEVSDGQSISLFSVTGHDVYKGEITFTTKAPIQQMYLDGTVKAPDSGSTVGLMSVALAAMAVLPILRRR